MDGMIGKELGSYRIVEQIGVGGMATVYKAHHTVMDRYVAVKVMPEQMSQDAHFRRRFEREVKAVARLEHAHILPVYDYGEVEGRLYLAMRYVEAGTLKDRMAAGPLNLAEVSRIIHQVGRALEYAHRKGIVHRDVKPSNVLMDAQGDCYLTDFGLAKMMESSVQLTVSGVGVGTPAYMSPEQGKGEKVDARSDVYSLGVMLYEMVTGQVPYEAETPLAVLLKHIIEPLPLPHEIAPGVPEGVERVVLKAMAKNPDDRFQTVRKMVAALEAAVQEAVVEKVKAPPSVVAPPPKTPTSIPRKKVPVPPPVEKPAVVKKPRLVRPPRHAPPPVTVPEAVRPTVMKPLQPFEPEMVLIPAGEFLMGSDPQEDKYAQDDEQPQHTLYLPDYYLAKTPVTNAQYAAFVQATGHRPPKHWRGGKPPRGTEAHPVVYVSWHEAVAYCNWLAEATGKFYRLPSEAEWEKGARGSDGRIYPWGNRWDAKRCNNSERGRMVITPVGTYPQGASPYGLLDMAGNVWEWVADWYDSGCYAALPESDPKGPASGDYRVIRGGSCYFNETTVRAANRFSYTPDLGYHDVGFRCAC